MVMQMLFKENKISDLTGNIKELLHESRFFSKCYLYKNSLSNQHTQNKNQVINAQKITHIKSLDKLFKKIREFTHIHEPNKVIKDIEVKPYKKYDDNAPKISIFIFNNNTSHLKQLFNSIIKHTDYPNYELILINNGIESTLMESLKSISRNIPLKIYNQKNQNFSNIYSQIMKYVFGDYVLFLNSSVNVVDGWLNHLLDTAISHDDVGAVGSRIVYSKEVSNNQLYIKNDGTSFKEINTQIVPYDINYKKPYVPSKTSTKPVPALSHMLLVEKSKFNEVGGFSLEYDNGFEIEDLCLKLYEKGYVNYCNTDSILFYSVDESEKSPIQDLLDKREEKNRTFFVKKWNTFLKKELFIDKINKNNIFTNKPLKIAFVVSEKGKHANIADYFIGMGLARSLNNMGYETEFLSEKIDDIYNINEDIDVLISFLNRYDIDKIKTKNSLLIKIAWVINWFEWWVNKSYFESYDIVLVSNTEGIKYIEKNTGYKPILFPKATDTSMYNSKVESVKKYECDYCFAGNYWDDRERDLVNSLVPEDIPYDFNLYGNWWDKTKLKSFYKKRISYMNMPKVYASTKIVLDDATDFTDTSSSINTRVFDALAVGVLVISNGKEGIREFFGDKLPIYDSKESLEELLDFYISNPDRRKAKVEQLQSMVLKHHTYDIRANKLVEILLDYVKSTKILIKIPVTEEYDKRIWGDYHFAIHLQHEFNKKGYYCKLQKKINWDSVSDGLYDVVILLRGLYEYVPKIIHYNIMWNISHPDLVSVGEYDSYNQVYVASKYWTNALKNVLKTDVEELLQCTDTTLFHRQYTPEYDTQLLFVGNSRNVYRKVLHDLLPTEYDLNVYGDGWKGIVDDKYIIAEHIPNKQLYKAYSSTKVVLNDHWKDMREKGFISNRIFDAVACGTVVLSDNIYGIRDIFPENAVVLYDGEKDINNKIEEALKIGPINPSLVKEHTFKKRVDKIIDDYEKKCGK